MRPKPARRTSASRRISSRLDERVTGTARVLASLLEDAGHLLLTQAVLGAKTLLLAQTNGVVAFLAAGGTTVLAGRVGTLLEVLHGLRRQGEAEGTREPHLAACLLN
ncbi:hypothetical protein GCM10025876_39330 [Demequina litorisediminis]|uniref:Uncharacterized protein n=1 Tax=Demequina litorisediminis TaxID=1849022 RepID=A0ABQ6IJ30_9MICO|nr:hypothetical protein GCM10025876_00360 [Demequina litorisediminis]GMA37729.1 hypothetical protein GCM10025876_39330 [Demequina litorisediminis]